MNNDKAAAQRAEANRDLVERMKRGESTARIDAAATFFPPRPIIVKDFKEMARVYGERYQTPDSRAPGPDSREA